MAYSLYSYFEQHPIEGIVYILFSLIVTLVIYGAFPLIIANSRKKTITAKKYKFLCYMVNFFVCFYSLKIGVLKHYLLNPSKFSTNFI